MNSDVSTANQAARGTLFRVGLYDGKAANED
jgi:hypothetical protein